MTPAEAISALDQALAEAGEMVTVRRGAETATAKAFVRAKSASEIAGTSGQMHWNVALSPTGLGTFGTPMINDDVTIKGKDCQVSFVEPVHMNGVLVRINLLAAG